MTTGWFKIRQAADYAGISVRTLRTWLRMGLKHSRVRGCILIRYSAIDDFLESHSAGEDEFEALVDGIMREIRR